MKPSFQYMLFWVLLICILNTGNAQTLQYNKSKNCYGISFISTRYAPIYLSWYRLNGNFKSYGLKAGAGYAYRYGDIYYYPFSAVKFKYSGDYIYVTPVWMPYRKTFNHKSVQLMLAVPLGYSHDQLTRNIIYDPLFQGKIYKQESHHLYTGVEFEAQMWFELNKNLVLTTGLTAGFKTSGQMPFQKELSGVLNSSYYYSGMYAGKYINISAGITYIPFRK